MSSPWAWQRASRSSLTQRCLVCRIQQRIGAALLLPNTANACLCDPRGRGSRRDCRALAGAEYFALRVRPVRSRLNEFEPRADGYRLCSRCESQRSRLRLSLRRWPSSGSSSARGVANGGFHRGCWPPAYLIRDTPGHLQWVPIAFLSGVAGSAIWFRIYEFKQWHCPGGRALPWLRLRRGSHCLLARALSYPALRSERSRRPTWQPWVGLRRQPRSVRPFS